MADLAFSTDGRRDPSSGAPAFQFPRIRRVYSEYGPPTPLQPGHIEFGNWVLARSAIRNIDRYRVKGVPFSRRIRRMNRF
jgi:hypothetical protein